MNSYESIYIYDSSLLITIGVPLLLLATFSKPKLFMCVLINLQFLRLNERFPIPVSFPTIMFPLLGLIFLLNYSAIKEKLSPKEVKYVIFIVGFVLGQSLLFYREDLTSNIMGCGFGLLYFLSIRAFLAGRSGVKAMSWSLLACCTLICLEPLYYHLVEPEGSQLLMRFQGNTGRLKAWGLWGNANETSFIACLGVGNLLLLNNLQKSKKFFLFSVPVVLFFVYIVLLTLSRSGIASIFLLFSIYLLQSKQIGLKLILIIIVVFSIVTIPSIIDKRTDVESSSSERFDLRYKGVELFKERPLLGVGFKRSKFETGGMALHCSYIQAFAELGVMGGIPLVMLVYLISKKNYNLLRRIRKSNRPIIMSGLIYSISGFYISGLFYLYFGNQFLTIIFFTFFGISMNYTDLCIEELEAEIGQ